MKAKFQNREKQHQKTFALNKKAVNIKAFKKIVNKKVLNKN